MTGESLRFRERSPAARYAVATTIFDAALLRVLADLGKIFNRAKNLDPMRPRSDAWPMGNYRHSRYFERACRIR